MSPARRWIVAIVGLLAGNVLAMTLLATFATVGHSEVIPDYYEQAAHYDDVMAQAAIDRRLGWRVDATLAGGRLELVVRDAAGQPIDGALVHVTGFPRAHAGERMTRVLSAETGGRYASPADDRPGIHDLAITVQARGATYIERAVVVAR